ncbi:MAG: LamG domain-containing protein [Halanaerobiaceae bacterium]
MFKKTVVYLVSIFMVMVFFISFAGAAELGPEWVEYNNDSEQLEYEGKWRNIEAKKAYQGRYIFSRHGSSVEFDFTGTQVKWIGVTNSMSGIAEVYLNDELVEKVDLYSSEEKFGQTLFSAEDLPEGENTLKIVPTGDSNEQASNAFVSIDKLAYVPTVQKSKNLLKENLEKAKKVLVEANHKPKKETGVFLNIYHSDEAREQFIDEIAGGLFLLSTENNLELILEEYRNMADNIEKFADKAISPEFTDLSKNDNSAVVASGKPRWVEGVQGNAVDIKTEDLIRVNDFDILDNEQHTIEFRLKLPEQASAGWTQLFGIKGPETDRSPGIWTNSDNPFKFHFRYDPGNTGFNHIGLKGDGEGPLAVDTWYHVAAVKDGETFDLYIDGEFIASTEVPQESAVTSFIEIGPVRNVVFDEIRIWNSVRTEEEIQKNQDNVIEENAEGLIGYWNFNDWK